MYAALVGSVLVLVAASAAQAPASPVLVLHGKTVTERNVPTLPSAAATTLPKAPGAQSRVPSATPTFGGAAIAAGTTIGGAVKRAASRGAITATDRSNYLKVYSLTRAAYARLSGNNKTQLGDVLATMQGIARRNQLTPSRMPAIFLTLDRNRQWWSVRGAPAAGARVSFPGSRVIFQYYPGHGLQLQMLGNFGNANGLWGEKKYTQFKELVDQLVALKSTRGDFTTWEYYFPFGGGRPPWTSGMSQGTALQALSRAGTTLQDPSYFEVGKSALGIYTARTPTGVRVPQSNGAWYALYSFAPSQYVLNGDLQALIGLYDFDQANPGTAAAQLFQDGDAGTRARIKSCDTGAWTLYQCPGAESDLNYQQVVTDFAKKICSRTDAEIYCNEADNFKSYLKTPPKMTDAHFAPAPVRRSKATNLGFNLSKVSTVTLQINGPDGGAVFTRSYRLAFGRRTLPWAAPRKPGTYTWSLGGVDLAGNKTAEPVTGTVRVT